jgi:ABC-2 type transport system permease protein
VASANGVIHDIGYQRYTGPRLGRRYAIGSLYTHSLRTAYGVGRGVKAKIFPYAIAGILTVIAVIALVIRSQRNQVALSYLNFSDAVSILLVLFLAAVTPELVSRDLRAGVLPLYFSRPLRRSDYALVKLAAAISAVWLLVAGPLLVMYLGGLFSQQKGWHGAWHETTDLLGGLAYAGIYAIVFTSISILVASLSGRRAFAAASIVAVFLVTAPVVGVLESISNTKGSGSAVGFLAPVLNPVTLVQGLHIWIFKAHDLFRIGGYGPAYLIVAMALVAACAALLLVRYRRVAR